jgi:hypothetical protein
MFLAERQQRIVAEGVATQALDRANAAQREVEGIQTATRLSEVSRRMQALVETGRITPAEHEVYAPNLAKFAEDDWFLKGLEGRAANSSVDMKQRGTGTTEEPSANANDVAHKGALAIMTERGQPTDMKAKGFYPAYRVALSEFSAREAKRNRLGYQG